jgi:hypothetical protein
MSLINAEPLRVQACVRVAPPAASASWKYPFSGPSVRAPSPATCLPTQKVEGSTAFELRAWCWAFPSTLRALSGLGRPGAAGQDVGQIERRGLLELRVAA